LRLSPAIDKLDAEIARLQAEVAHVEHMPRTIAERFAEVEAELRSAEQLYRNNGHKVGAAHPEQTAYLQRQAVLGACMVVGADQLLRADRQRIEAQGEGMSAADKARKLAELRRQILCTAAKRELALREVEGDGEFQPRVTHPELAIYRLAVVEQLAR
jgi:phage-related tail protein